MRHLLIFVKHLDLGCGNKPRNPYGCEELFGIDQSNLFSGADVRACQLGLEPFPFPSDYFDSVSAYDLLEHIPRQSIDYANNNSFSFHRGDAGGLESA